MKVKKRGGDLVGKNEKYIGLALPVANKMPI